MNERRLCFAQLMPYLIEPEKKRRRSHVRTLFFLQLLQTLDGEDKSTAKLRSYLARHVEEHKSALSKTGSYESYLRAFYVDAWGNGRYIRDVVATGLTVKALASEHGIGKRGKRTLSAAQEYIIENHETGVVLANDIYLSTTWSYNKPIAHLCTAFVEFLQSNTGHTLCINSKLLQVLETQMDRFVVTAHRYQDFLAGRSVLANAPLSSKLNANLSLLLLPNFALNAHPYTNPALPRWDVRRSQRISPPGTA